MFAAGAELMLEPGRLVIHVGGGQPGYKAQTLNTTITISGETTMLDNCP